MWIEILIYVFLQYFQGVTLFTRVWIEILQGWLLFTMLYCHSLYESVNWNLTQLSLDFFTCMSLSLRECELKFCLDFSIFFCVASLSLRECELKFRLKKMLSPFPKVTLFTRVWIEIHLFFSFRFIFPSVTLFTRVWIEIIY